MSGTICWTNDSGYYENGDVKPADTSVFIIDTTISGQNGRTQTPASQTDLEVSTVEIPCCSFRVKTWEPYKGYRRLDELPYAAVIDGLSRQTTVHGVPNLKWAKGCVKKGFWLVMTLIMTGAWLWNSYDILKAFTSFEVSIRSDIRLEHEVEFPAITICNQNVARSSKLNSDAEARGILNAPESKILATMEKRLGEKNGDFDRKRNLHPSRSVMVRRRALVKERLSCLNLKTKMEYGHQFRPLISRALFSEFEVSNTTFQKFYDPTYGNCYSFNVGPKGTEDIISAYSTGPDYGLSITFDIEQAEYLSGITSKAGLRVVVHSRHSAAFPAEMGIDVPPGEVTSIGLRKAQMKRLGGVYNRCLDITESHADINAYEDLFNWTRYTMLGCRHTCYQRQVIQNCGCYDQNFPNQGIAFTGLNRSQVCRMDDQMLSKCKSRIYRRFCTGELNCAQCLKPCTEDLFEKTISASKWPADKYQETLKNEFYDNPYIQRVLGENSHTINIGLLEIHFETLNVEYMNECASYDYSQFIADIGGAVGLWLGASLLTVLEILEFLLDLIVLACAKHCRGRRQRDRRKQRPKDDRKPAEQLPTLF